jgi:DNA modification methylase
MKPYYKNDLTTIYNGDCLEVMKNIKEKISLVITSPPYNIVRPNCTDRGYDVYKDREITNKEYSKWITDIFNIYNKILKKDGVVLFNMSYGAENTEVMNLTVADIIQKTNFTIADIIIWKKKNATPNNVSKNRLTRIVEFVYVFVRKDEIMTFNTNKRKIGERENTKQAIYENVYNYFTTKNNDKSTEINKATFSSDFVKKLLDIYYIKGTVLDNFGGTGTTTYTCMQNSIKNIMIELSIKQCEYAVKRIEKIQLKLF